MELIALMSVIGGGDDGDTTKEVSPIDFAARWKGTLGFASCIGLVSNLLFSFVNVGFVAWVPADPSSGFDSSVSRSQITDRFLSVKLIDSLWFDVFKD